MPENLKQKRPAEVEKPRPPLAEKPEERIFDFLGTENKTRFERLSEGAKNFAAKLYEVSGASGAVEKARISSVDRLKVMYDSALYDWHDKKAEKWSSKLYACDARIGSINDQIEDSQKSFQSMRDQYSEIAPSLEQKVQREIMGLRRQLETLGNKKDRFQSKLEFRNNKKAIYEGKRKEIVRDVSERIQERLEPYERRIETLQGQKDELDTQIGNLENMRVKLAEDLKELEEKKKVANWIELEQLKFLIGKTKEEQKKIKNYISPKIKGRQQIEEMLVPLYRKANSWRDKQVMFHRISQRETIYEETGERVEVPIDLKRRGVGISERVSEPSEETRSQETRVREAEEAAGPERAESRIGREGREKIEDRKLPPTTYIKEWNKYFGAEFPLESREFEEHLKILFKLSKLKELTVVQLDNALQIYYTPRLEEWSFWIFSPKKAFSKRLESFRFYLSKLLEK